jgi:mRNA-degrading endonuclease RelE of RelBE toxin-antitoxin system
MDAQVGEAAAGAGVRILYEIDEAASTVYVINVARGA